MCGDSRFLCSLPSLAALEGEGFGGILRIEISWNLPRDSCGILDHIVLISICFSSLLLLLFTVILYHPLLVYVSFQSFVNIFICISTAEAYENNLSLFSC